MASSIQLLRSTNPQERPFAGNLLEGQPAANLHSSEPGLFFKTTDGSVVKFGPAAITSDGSPPNSTPQGSTGNSVGELWLDKSVDPAVLKVYDGAQWVNAGSGGGGGGGGTVAFVRWIYTAIGGETSLSGTSGGVLLDYTPGLEEVYVNGVLTTRGVDYSATNGSSITNLAALSAGDVVTVLSMNPLETVLLPGQVSLLRWTVLATTGQTALSGVDVSGQQLAYTAGLEEVYVNGAFLRRDVDYVATNGSVISGLSPLSEDDEVTVLAWTPFAVANFITDAEVLPNANISASKLAYSTGSTSRTVQDRLYDRVSVLDYIPESEHAGIKAGTSFYDCTADVQAAVDSLQDFSELFFPRGTYYFGTTSETGNDLILAETGTVADNPDFICVKVVEKTNVKVSGCGAKIRHPRGYAFYSLLCERLTFEGLTLELTQDPFDPLFTPPANYEPSAIVIIYSVFCSISKCKAFNENRAFFIQRTSGCSAVECEVFNNAYIGISSYGQIYQPPGWTAAPLSSFFSVPTPVGLDAGTLISNCLVDRYRYVGIYTAGAALIIGNRVQRPLDVGISSPGGTTGINSSRGYATILGNYIYADSTVAMRDGTQGYSGIVSKLEDVTGSPTSDDRIIDNYIRGGETGITIQEGGDSEVRGNHIVNYTRSAINILAAPAVSDVVNNVRITENFISAVDPNTTCSNTTYDNVGGIVTSTLGSYSLTNVYITQNTFRRKWSSIVDAGVRAQHKFDIRCEALSGSHVTTLPNDVDFDDPGLIYTPTDGLYAGRQINSYSENVTASKTISVPPGIVDSYIYASASLTITLPKTMPVGSRIHLMNKGSGTVTVNSYSGAYTISGLNSVSLNNSSPISPGDFTLSSVVLLVTGNTSTAPNEAYTCEVISSSSVNGGIVQL